MEFNFQISKEGWNFHIKSNFHIKKVTRSLYSLKIRQKLRTGFSRHWDNFLRILKFRSN